MRNFLALLSGLFQRATDPFRKKDARGYDTKRQRRRPMIAICVGHSRSGDRGAESVGGVSEWEFWQPIAYRAAEILRDKGMSAKVVDVYDGGSYGAAMSWLGRHLEEMGAVRTVELHFNSAGPSAEGHEWIYWGGSKLGAALAKDLEAAHSERFPGFRCRGVKGKGMSDRGGLFLRRTPCPAVICEAFFGSNRKEWVEYSKREEELAEAIADGIGRNIAND
jgi:N-acetylmuramoyl-L-alanine amidase